MPSLLRHVVHRPEAPSYPELDRGGYDPADVGLGRAYRLAQGHPEREVGGDGYPTPGLFSQFSRHLRLS
jgi:hypothetical protein